MLRWNPHFHAIVLEGGFDEYGRFFYIPFNGLQAMVELFRRRVIRLLTEKGPAGRETCRRSIELETLRVQHRQQRPHPGPPRIGESRRVHLTSTDFVEENPLRTVQGKVLFHTNYSEYLKENVHLFNALEFIAELTRHVPPKGVQLIRRYGLCSSRIKGRSPTKLAREQLGHISRRAPEGWRQQHAQATNVEDDQGFEPSARICRRQDCRYPKRWRWIPLSTNKRGLDCWRRSTRLIRSSVPAPYYRRCGSEMKVIAVIQDPRLSVLTQQRSRRFLPTW